MNSKYNIDEDLPRCSETAFTDEMIVDTPTRRVYSDEWIREHTITLEESRRLIEEMVYKHFHPEK